MNKTKVMLLVGLSGIILAACGTNEQISNSGRNASEATTENTSSSISVEETSSSLLMDDPDFDSIAINNGAEESTITDRIEYKIEWSDSSWSGVDISIDSANILKVDNYTDYSDNTYEGFVILHFNVNNTERDLNIYPQQATLSTDAGEQTEGNYLNTGWDGEFMANVTKDGYAVYPLTKLEDINTMKSVRLKWNGYYDTEDYDDENANKEYDVTVNFQPK